MILIIDSDEESEIPVKRKKLTAKGRPRKRDSSDLSSSSPSILSSDNSKKND